jgi:hypothetical protein
LTGDHFLCHLLLVSCNCETLLKVDIDAPGLRLGQVNARKFKRKQAESGEEELDLGISLLKNTD